MIKRYLTFLVLLFCISCLTTNLQPTSTIIPTQTYTPMPTITPTPNQLELSYQYINNIASKSELCAETWIALTEITSLFSENSSLIFDKTVNETLNGLIDNIEENCSNYSIENPPTIFIEVNELLSKYDKEIILFINLFRIGIDNYDANSINTASDHLSNANEYMNQAIDLLNSMFSE